MCGWVSALAALLSACGVEFDSIAQVDGVRIMAVQKSKPYADPGEEVELRMLYHDTGVRGPGDTEGEPRDVQLFWLSGCENPPGDLYALCIAGFQEAFGAADIDLSSEDVADLSEEQREDLTELAAAIGIGIGFDDTFSFEVSEDIISRRPPPPDPSLRRYGLNVVFFAACAGELRLDFDNAEFPMACLDEDGDPVDSRDFVAGYTNVFSYEGASNDNPAIEGLEIDGDRVPRDQLCIGEECEFLPSDPDRECGEEDVRVAACPDSDDTQDCDTIELLPLIDRDSVETDEVSAGEGTNLEEQMWVNFHADRGQFTFDVSLINDAVVGFNEDPTTEYIGASQPGPAQIWFVVRDSRGGSEWARVQVCVED